MPLPTETMEERFDKILREGGFDSNFSNNFSTEKIKDLLSKT